ncbi:pimeloyl-[acyl-carrier protein] methyl ester esterase [Kushneria avicenniae]|uniref:Pimeloyl-[acyl-carrier protein] methyl ester esterase n=1 Tax=Kushneria avicenniae TaxID=402385 RepID=A0A1I1MYV8_9GAMM|nr:alpha/beta fold hydrolase [Kushneria avicenniae]SFC88438.1 pimeloyl-[acyl-carrier protein] methyl ester esterase [Kushneria avicenniae]
MSITPSPTLILLPGWAIAPSAMAPLASALEAQLPGWTISTIPLPLLEDDHPETWLDELDSQLPDHAWLAGWSLGGMLAMALSARRGKRCPGVITLGSNASFITRDDWGCALPIATLVAFRNRWSKSPEATFSRFAALAARGSANTGHMARHIEQHSLPLNLEHALAGLSMLQQMDLRTLLPQHRNPGLHLFAEYDAMVPASACAAVAELLSAGSETHTMADTGHAFPLEHPERCADIMAAFIRRHDGDQADER